MQVIVAKDYLINMKMKNQITHDVIVWQQGCY